MEKETALEMRKKHIAPSLGLHYSAVKPLKIVYGRGQYLYDECDQPYLDCINNVTHVGHCHPRVVEAGAEQMARLADFPDLQITQQYTQHLLSTFPDNMGHVFYVHSGTEANDLALMIAEAVTGHSEVIVIDGAYHGHTKPLVGLSSYKMKQEKEGQARISPNPHAWISCLPDTFRGKYTDRATAGDQYAGEVKRIIDSMEQEGKKPAAFLCESFPGCAGQVQLPEGYFKAVFEYDYYIHVHVHVILHSIVSVCMWKPRAR
jgi:4-aminobutyrate aminotransferase-like enzyme